MSDDLKPATVRMPTFSGKQQDWVYYKLQLQAYNGAIGCADVLSPSFDTELPATEAKVLTSSDEDKKKELARKKNTKVMQALVMGMKEKQMLNAIELSKTDEWPSGKAWRVFEQLDEDFWPDTELAGIEMNDELQELRLKKTDDPRDLVHAIAAIEVRFKKKLSEDKRKETVLRSTREHYAEITTSLCMNMELIKNRAPTSKEYLEHVRKNWKAKGNKSGKIDGTKPSETALSAPEGDTQMKFKGKCYNCGQKGHRKADCPRLRSKMQIMVVAVAVAVAATVTVGQRSSPVHAIHVEK